jgi:hypothetical protein
MKDILKYIGKSIYYYKGKDILWFRVFGIGLSFDKKMKFSQRYGHSKFIKIGPWIITTLKKSKL